MNAERQALWTAQQESRKMTGSLWLSYWQAWYDSQQGPVASGSMVHELSRLAFQRNAFHSRISRLYRHTLIITPHPNSLYTCFTDLRSIGYEPNATDTTLALTVYNNDQYWHIEHNALYEYLRTVYHVAPMTIATKKA